jgi:hypothetical protein
MGITAKEANTELLKRSAYSSSLDKEGPVGRGDVINSLHVVGRELATNRSSVVPKSGATYFTLKPFTDSLTSYALGLRNLTILGGNDNSGYLSENIAANTQKFESRVDKSLIDAGLEIIEVARTINFTEVKNNDGTVEPGTWLLANGKGLISVEGIKLLQPEQPTDERYEEIKKLASMAQSLDPERRAIFNMILKDIDQFRILRITAIWEEPVQQLLQKHLEEKKRLELDVQAKSASAENIQPETGSGSVAVPTTDEVNPGVSQWVAAPGAPFTFTDRRNGSS